MQAAVTLAAVPAWRLVTHAPWLALHPVRLLAATLGLRSLGTALLLATLQAAVMWASCQVVHLASRFVFDEFKCLMSSWFTASPGLLLGINSCGCTHAGATHAALG
jgi:hypothetical protein